MRQILSDIRALSGVTGVAVIGKRSGSVDHLFPATFTERHTQYLRDLITSTYQRLRGFARLSLRFERVVVHLYNQPEFLMFVTTLPDTDARQFEMVVNSKLPAIARSMDAAGSIPASGSGALASRPSVPRASGDDITARLIAICNSLSDQMAESRGRLRIANDWRRARDLANGRDGTLGGLVVDAAGRLQLRKDQTLPANAATMASLAFMLDTFFAGLGAERVIVEEEFHLLMKPYHSLFEPTGLFLYLSQGQRARSFR